MLTSRKIVLSLCAVGAAASIAGLGTYATFTDSDSATTGDISTGTVDINLGAAGADNRLSIGATGMVPGDALQRRVKLTNAGTEDLASIKLTTTAPVTSLLDTDATNGLQMKIERCTGVGASWVESVTTPYTYTCNLGTKSDVLASRQVIGADLALTTMSALTSGQTDDMVVTLTLPSTAGNTFQNKTSTIKYQFDAVQRAATDK